MRIPTCTRLRPCSTGLHLAVIFSSVCTTAAFLCIQARLQDQELSRAMVQFTLSDELKQALVQVRRSFADSPSISCLLDLNFYLSTYPPHGFGVSLPMCRCTQGLRRT